MATKHKLNDNKHPMSCKAQTSWKCLFTPIFFTRQFWPTKLVRLT